MRQWSNYNSWNPCTSIFNIIRIGFPLKGHCCKLMLSELQFWDEFIYIRTDPGHKKYAWFNPSGLKVHLCKSTFNLTKVRPPFSLSHRGFDSSPLLIVFSADYIDQSIVTFMELKVFWKLWPFNLSRLPVWGNTKT